MHRPAVPVVGGFLALALGAVGGSTRPAHGQALSGEDKIGVLDPLTGPLAFEGERHLGGPEIVRDVINGVDLGIVQVPEGRRLFPFMSVTENLILGAHSAHARDARDQLTVAECACVLESGKLVLEGRAGDLLGDDRLKRAYPGL